jgi:hypothetical protein
MFFTFQRKYILRDILNIAFPISVDDVIDKSLAMELIVLMKFSYILSTDSSSFSNSSLRISNLLLSRISF